MCRVETSLSCSVHACIDGGRTLTRYLYNILFYFGLFYLWHQSWIGWENAIYELFQYDNRYHGPYINGCFSSCSPTSISLKMMLLLMYLFFLSFIFSIKQEFFYMLSNFKFTKNITKFDQGQKNAHILNSSVEHLTKTLDSTNQATNSAPQLKSSLFL